MKKLLLILLCFPLIFSCNNKKKETQEEIQTSIDSEVYISLWDNGQYNTQNIDGYKQFTFGAPISRFQNNLTEYYRDTPSFLQNLPNPKGFYHFSDQLNSYQALSTRYRMTQQLEGYYTCRFESEFQDIISRIAVSSIRSSFYSSNKTYYYKDNESYTFLGHPVRDIILVFYHDSIEKIILIFSPPYNIDNINNIASTDSVFHYLANNHPADPSTLGQYQLAMSLQNRFSHENRFSCSLTDNNQLSGEFFSCWIYGFRTFNSNQVQNRGVSIIQDSYMFYYNDKLERGNIVTLISDQRRHEEAVRLNNDL